MIVENKIYLGDCLDFMQKMPDKSVDLVLTDPPYGGVKEEAPRSRFGGRFDKYYIPQKKINQTGLSGGKYEKGNAIITHWDVAPEEAYFNEIFRISKFQIIWGGNYFGLPPTRCFFVWDKLTISESFSMAMCEYAWTNFAGNAKRFEAVPQDKSRFHPTQKPLKLIKWCIAQAEQYTGRDILIFDPYSGSGTTAVACHELGRRFICVEKEAVYYKASCERLENRQKQTLLNFAQESEESK